MDKGDTFVIVYLIILVIGLIYYVGARHPEQIGDYENGSIDANGMEAF